MSNVVLKYGTYNFSPVPLMSITKNYNTAQDGTILGEDWQIALDGTLTTVGGPSGLAAVRQKQDDLAAALNKNGQLLLLTCDGSVLMSGYPVVDDLSIPEGIWVFQAPYTINMNMGELTAGSGSGFVTDASEEWNVEFDDTNYWSWTLPGASGDSNTYRLRLSHSVSATGRPRYLANSKVDAITNAKSFVTSRLGFDSTKISQDSVLNLTASQFGAYDHIRSVSENDLAGSYSVTETWLVQNTGITNNPGNAVEDFTIALHQSNDSPFVSVSIDGNIQGVETRSYGAAPGLFSISETKYASASGTWNVIKNRLLGRANLLLDTVYTARDINPVPLSTQVGHNPNTGNISYNYEYNTRPTTCIAGATSETISIVDNDPTDVFTSITIPGRAIGPILQDLNTKTAATREVSIEAVIAAPTGCPSSGNVANYLGQEPKAAVNTMLNAFQDDLESTYSQVFTTNRQINWSPTEGRISAQASWTYQNCS